MNERVSTTVIGIDSTIELYANSVDATSPRFLAAQRKQEALNLHRNLTRIIGWDCVLNRWRCMDRHRQGADKQSQGMLD